MVSETATVFSAPEASTSASRAAWDSNGSAGGRIVSPESAASFSRTRAANSGMRVQAGADRGTAERDLPDALERRLDAGRALADLGGVAAELLAQRHGNRVHPVRAARLDHVVELLRLRSQRVAEPTERRQEVVDQLVQRREVHGGREDVVRRLPHVHVVVGVDSLARERRHHLVGVHVRRRARAGLEDVDRELVVELARGDAIPCGRDPLRLLCVEQAQLGVHARGGRLDPAEPARYGRRESARRRPGSWRSPWRSRRPRAPAAPRSGPRTESSFTLRAGGAAARGGRAAAAGCARTARRSMPSRRTGSAGTRLRRYAARLSRTDLRCPQLRHSTCRRRISMRHGSALPPHARVPHSRDTRPHRSQPWVRTADAFAGRAPTGSGPTWSEPRRAGRSR